MSPETPDLYVIEDELATLALARETAQSLAQDPAVRAYLAALDEQARLEEEIKAFVRTTGIRRLAAAGLEVLAVPKSHQTWDAPGLAKRWPWLVDAGVISLAVDRTRLAAQIKVKAIPEVEAAQYATVEPITTAVTIRTQVPR